MQYAWYYVYLWLLCGNVQNKGTEQNIWLVPWTLTGIQYCRVLVWRLLMVWCSWPCLVSSPKYKWFVCASSASQWPSWHAQVLLSPCLPRQGLCLAKLKVYTDVNNHNLYVLTESSECHIYYILKAYIWCYPLPPRIWFVHLWKCWHFWTAPNLYVSYTYLKWSIQPWQIELWFIS